MTKGRPAPSGWRYRRAPVLLLLLLALAARPAAERRSVVIAEPGGTAVGMSVILSAGSSWELSSEAGLARLAAEAVLEEIAPRLGVLGGRATVESDASTVRYTLLLPPDNWAVAAELFLEVLFSARVGEAAVERARQTLLRTHGRPSAFTTEIRRVLEEALHGEQTRWSRPALGRAETLQTLRADDVRAMLRSRFTPSRATAAVVGPVDEAEARTLLRSALGDAVLPVLSPAPPETRPNERHVERATITSWVSLAFPFPEETDVEALHLLGTYLEERLAPAPARPDVLAASIELRRHGAGGTLAVHLVVPPDRTEHWVSRVHSLVREAARSTLEEKDFGPLLRRHLGRRLRSLAAPEQRARDAALQLFFGHRYRQPEAQIEALDPERLRQAAASLGTPAEAVLGPR